MKKILASILIAIPLLALTVPFAMADDAATETGIGDAATQAKIKDASSFNVFDILSPDEESEKKTLDAVLQDAADKGTSPAGAIILKAINILMLLIGTFAFVLIIIGGFMFVTSNGDEPSIDRAKALLTQSVIGLVIAFFSYLIVYFIQSFFYP